MLTPGGKERPACLSGQSLLCDSSALRTEGPPLGHLPTGRPPGSLPRWDLRAPAAAHTCPSPFPGGGQTSPPPQRGSDGFCTAAKSWPDRPSTPAHRGVSEGSRVRNGAGGASPRQAPPPHPQRRHSLTPGRLHPALVWALRGRHHLPVRQSSLPGKREGGPGGQGPPEQTQKPLAVRGRGVS